MEVGFGGCFSELDLVGWQVDSKNADPAMFACIRLEGLSVGLLQALFCLFADLAGFWERVACPRSLDGGFFKRLK